MIVRYFALVMGILFVLAGVGGFVPFVTPPPPPDFPPLTINTSYGLLLGLFPVNLIHNLIHFSWGVWGIWAWRRYASARLYARILAPVLAIFSVLGVISTVYTTFGLLPLFGHDVWLHGLEALLAGYLGYFYRLPKHEAALAARG